MSIARSITAPDAELSDADEVTEAVWELIYCNFLSACHAQRQHGRLRGDQFITGVLRTEGYAGLINRSAFALWGYSIAAFDLDAAFQPESCLSQVSTATFEFRELTID